MKKIFLRSFLLGDEYWSPGASVGQLDGRKFRGPCEEQKTPTLPAPLSPLTMMLWWPEAIIIALVEQVSDMNCNPSTVRPLYVAVSVNGSPSLSAVRTYTSADVALSDWWLYCRHCQKLYHALCCAENYASMKSALTGFSCNLPLKN